MIHRRICIVSHAGYRALTGGTSGHIGGVERQTSFLAKWLAARGHSVDFVTWRHGAETEAMVDGVRMLTVCSEDEGIRGLRFVHPRWTSLVRALRYANADTYYHNTGEVVTGQVGLWCRTWRRRFVFSSASHGDCDGALPFLPTRRERILYRIGLRCADAVIVQNETQRRLMQVNFGRASEVVAMPCPEPDLRDVLRPDEGPPSARVLWVGRLCPEKRAELLIDVAKHAPDLQFDVVGPIENAAYGEPIVAEIRRLANVTYHGRVVPSAMPELYRRAVCLLCTSHLEGLPNTFLEAWSQGLPVVSTWDPDNVIRHRELGVACASTPAAVADAVRSLASSPDRWSRASSHARTYYMAMHRPELTFSAFERILVGEETELVNVRNLRYLPRR